MVVARAGPARGSQGAEARTATGLRLGLTLRNWCNTQPPLGTREDYQTPQAFDYLFSFLERLHGYPRPQLCAQLAEAIPQARVA
jgi:hypothetical protein